MAGYRLYCLNGAGKIESADWVEAQDDEEAIALVRARNLPAVCELWDRSRLVARIPDAPEPD